LLRFIHYEDSESSSRCAIPDVRSELGCKAVYTAADGRLFQLKVSKLDKSFGFKDSLFSPKIGEVVEDRLRKAASNLLMKIERSLLTTIDSGFQEWNTLDGHFTIYANDKDPPVQ